MKTQVDLIIHLIQHMDIDMINDILDNKRTYQDFEKWKFVQLLNKVFEEFAEKGNTFLNVYSGKCTNTICPHCNNGYIFVGNKSFNHIDFIISQKDGVVIDILQCKNLKSDKLIPGRLAGLIYLDENSAASF